MNRLDDAIRNLMVGEKIDIGDGAIVIRRMDANSDDDKTTLKIGADVEHRKITMTFPISNKAIANPTFDIERFVKVKLAKGIIHYLKRHDRTHEG